MPNVDLAYAFGLPPERAIAYFAGKGYKITWNWREMWQDAHAKAFTVAGVMKQDVLQDIHDALEKALKEGTTERDFIKGLQPILEQKGWWGKDAQTDLETGEMSGKGLTPRRLQTIYRTNTQTAYMAGRYKALLDNADNRPWWMYTAIMDGRTRPSHAALNGRVFRFDDPFWDYFFPPNGFNCRCSVRALSDRSLAAEGIDVSSSQGKLTQTQVRVSRANDADLVQVAKFKVNALESVRPDPGWSYNPGKAAFANLLEVATSKLDAAAPEFAAQTVHDLVAGPAFTQFIAEPQGFFPIATLPAETAAKIGAEVTTVRLSADTMVKQLRQHPELAASEYAFAQEAIDRGRVIQDSPLSLIFLLEEDGYVTVVKATETRKAVFLSSLRRLSADEVKRDREVQRLLKKGGGS